MIKNILLVTLLVLSGSAFAQAETYNVVGKKHYKGENLVRLRALSNQKLNAMGENPSDFQMVGVTVFAKSRRGKGKATLILGQDKSTKNIPKMGGDLLFVIESPLTFTKMHWNLKNAPGTSNERWQLRFNGNIKVRSIQVHMASRTKRIRIPMNGVVLKGQNTIYLKQELRDLGYKAKRFKLRKVTLVAKSRQGKGRAELQIGQKMKPQKLVAGSKNGVGFQNNNGQSFNRIQWRAKGPTQGAWQIHTRGRIKVKAVIVEVQRK